MKKTYMVKNVDYDGEIQQFSEIGSKKELKLWLSDGSIQDGDIIGEFKPLFLAKEKTNKKTTLTPI